MRDGVREPPPPPYQNAPREQVHGQLNTQLLEGILLAVQEELRNAGLELPLAETVHARRDLVRLESRA